MGVYEDIRKSTYTKPQGVYARIHANDKKETPKVEIAKSVEPVIDMSKYTPEEQKMLSSGQYKVNPTYDPNNKYSPKLLYSGELKTSENLNENAKGLDKAKIVAGKVGNTLKDIVASAGVGAISAAEGLANTGIAAVGNIANLVGAKDAGNYLTNMVKDDITGELQQKLDTSTKSGYGRYTPSILGMDVRNISQEGARMLTAGVGGLPGFIGSAIGGNTQEALNEGQSLGRASIYGGITGTIEGATEKLFDTFKLLGGGVLDKVIPKNVVARLATAPLGEYVEEWISQGANPFVKMATYDADIKNPVGSWDNFKEWLSNNHEAGWQGFVMGLVLQGGSDISNAEARQQYKNEVTKAVDKIKGLTQQQKQEAINKLVKESEDSKIQIEQVMQNYKQNSQYDKYIPQTQEQNIKLPTSQKNVARELPTNDFQEQSKQTILPTQKIQETVNSAKIVGMSDFDVKKAQDMHKMLQSGSNLKFYDSKNVPAGVDSRAINANGFYKDGTLWINKDSKRQVEKILGHELTHHLENTKVYTDFANAILDSNMFYDYITTQGYDNVAQFKENLRQRGYSDQEMDSEMVSMFVEDNLFDSQEKIDRIARENRTLAQKILNWLSDMKTRLVGTSQEKELLRIENMYRKAIQQANSTNIKTDAKYSVKNVADFNQTEYNNIQEIQLPAKEYGRLAHIVDTDTSIKPGLNYVETSDSTYVIYQKEYNDFKVVGKLEGGGVNDAVTNRNIRGIDETRNAREGLQNTSENIQNERAAENNDELLDRNTRGRNNEVESDNDGVRNKQNVAGKEPAFSLPETDNQGRKLSAEQQEFFKDSKVRDEDGNLQVMYHGTNGEFAKFNKGTANGWLGKGIYLTTKKDYAKKQGKKTMAVYANLSNPFISKSDDPFSFISEVQKIYPEADSFNVAEVLQRNGYDGIIYTHWDAEVGTMVNAFEPNQIKNVDNTSPTENVDIRYSINPIDIAKNPPNPQSGLDALKRAGREKVGDSQSSFMRNIHNQSIFDDTFKEMAWDDKNIRTYGSISNKETMQQANDAINEQGQKWVDRFKDKNSGEMKAVDIAGGFILMNRYQQVGDYESMLRIAEKLREAGTRQGQTIQLFSILGRMTPEGMTYYAQKELSKAYDEILKNKTQAWADEHADEFKLTEKDIDFIQRRVNQAAKLPEGRDKYVLLGEIASRIQSKIPPQPGQSLKALARNSMLLNPKTMVRNVLGNVVIAPAHIVSDFVGTGIDKAISNKTGSRTTGTFDIKSLKGAKKGFYESFDDFRRGITTRDLSGDRFEIGKGGKNFSENHTGIFATPRDALGKALNALDRVTGYLLESGDRPFYETWFINSLNNQMELNNAVKPTAEMIQIATEEALQRTWQDNNTYSNAVSGIREFLNLAKINGYGIGDMVMPFVKTPANLTKAIVDFSPLGAINALIKTSQFNKDIGKGQATAAQQRAVVKAWSQVITGTLGMAIATALAEAGVLGGGSDEDKDVREFEQKILGIKPYSIKIGDKTYTYDWAQPLGTSAAIVADTVKSLKNSKDMEDKLNAILQGATSGASVFLDQSFVKSIRQFFEEDGMISGLLELIMNEPSKFTPQFLSQIAQIQDDTARTSYVYNNPLETAKNKIKAKIPGLRETLEPSVDVLGREVKTDNSVGNVMFNPANTAFARTTKGAEEMYRVYQATGDKAAIAQVAPYYFNVGSDKIVLTPQQRTQYQKTTGKIASDGVENLLKNNAYKLLEDVDKAEILKDLYSYGNAIAKAEASKKYLLPKEFQKIKDSGMQPEEYILMKYIANSGGTKREELYNALISSGYSKIKVEDFLEDYKGYKFDNTSKNTLPTSSLLRSKLPSLKK